MPRYTTDRSRPV